MAEFSRSGRPRAYAGGISSGPTVYPLMDDGRVVEEGFGAAGTGFVRGSFGGSGGEGPPIGAAERCGPNVGRCEGGFIMDVLQG